TVITATLLRQSRLENPLAIFAMNRLQPVERGGIKAGATAAPHLLIGRADIEHPAFLGIGHPEYLANLFHHLTEATFAFAERGFSLLAGGYVLFHAFEIEDFTLRIAHYPRVD